VSSAKPILPLSKLFEHIATYRCDVPAQSEKHAEPSKIRRTGMWIASRFFRIGTDQKDQCLSKKSSGQTWTPIAVSRAWPILAVPGIGRLKQEHDCLVTTSALHCTCKLLSRGSHAWCLRNTWRHFALLGRGYLWDEKLLVRSQACHPVSIQLVTGDVALGNLFLE